MRNVQLPAAEAAGAVNRALAGNAGVIVTAPPGAGKSTLLPLTIHNALGGRILMLEPRRLAARQIAERLAWMLEEAVGKTVGYRVRFESRVSPSTRIEVLTEGILTRMLVEDPFLEGVTAVIFDEFHERSLNCDLALALVRESFRTVRPDLRIVIMSATMDTGALCRELGYPVVSCEGRMFPVDVIYEGDIEPGDCASAVASVVRRANASQEGDILAFLPGEADIRKCAELLGNSLGSTAVFPLYGMLPPEKQRLAIAPSAPGERKVVLSTPIAETSVTIEGVRVVIDSGYCRKMVFNPGNSMSSLETVRISMDMAVQRCGRAGRVAPGVCYRLWTLATEARMEVCRVPEILVADLAPAALDIAAWGERDPLALPWLTPPPAFGVSSALRLLNLLGAVGPDGRITEYGKRLSALPCHPRIAAMLLSSDAPGIKSLACDTAAVLEDKDPLSLEEAGADITLRINALRKARVSRNAGRFSNMIRISAQYAALVRAGEDNSPADPFTVGSILCRAYPERIAKASSEAVGSYTLSGSGSAGLDRNDALATCDYLVVASMNASRGSLGKIFLAAPVTAGDLEGYAKSTEKTEWDSRRGSIVAVKEERIGAVVLNTKHLANPSAELVRAALCNAAVKDGMGIFDFGEKAENLWRRVAAVSSWHPELCLPDLSPLSFLSMAGSWLPDFGGRAVSAAELKRIDITAAMWSLLDYSQRQAVERLAPSHMEVPTGSRITLEYRQGAEAPIARVRLQECFGMTETPRVNEGRIPVLMELLSPGYKPVQLTSDLANFWKETYFEVRKELRRRYPKHFWPDNPLESEAVRGVKNSSNK